MVNILVLQIEDRMNNDLIQKLMKDNKTKCEKNGIQYHFQPTSTDDVPPYWGKIFEIDKLLSDRGDVDYIYWMDSDAFFIHVNKEILEKVIDENSDYSMIVSKDMPPWSGEFNAGSFIVKNDEKGREIIRAWKSLYKASDWTKESEKSWKTESTWGGDAYEQGSFVNNIINSDAYSRYIKVLPYYVLNNNNCVNKAEETVVAHLAGEHKENEETISHCKKNMIEAFMTFENGRMQDILLSFAVTLFLISIFVIFMMRK
jgi:hypothetical protein